MRTPHLLVRGIKSPATVCVSRKHRCLSRSRETVVRGITPRQTYLAFATARFAITPIRCARYSALA